MDEPILIPTEIPPPIKRAPIVKAEEPVPEVAVVAEETPDTPPPTVESGNSMRYDFSLPAESAAPPDLTLGSSRPFTMGLGPSILGRGIRTSVHAGVLYDDNIFMDDEQQEDDLIFSAGLDVDAEFGNANRGVSLHYAIDGYAYADHSDRNAVNHSVGLSAYKRFGRMDVTLSLGYQHATGSSRDLSTSAARDVETAAVREAGTSTGRDSVSASLEIVRELGAKTRISAGANHSSMFSEDFNDSKDTAAHIGVDRRVGGKTRLGIGLVAGYLTSDAGAPSVAASEPEPVPLAPAIAAPPAAKGGTTTTGTTGAPPAAKATGTRSAQPDPAVAPATPRRSPDQSDGLDQAYQQLNLTFDYRATDKLNASGSLGWEWRSSDEGQAQGGFVYDLSLSYRIRHNTFITARGSRRTFASALYNNANRTSTSFEVSLNQTILERFNLSVACGYERSEYEGSPGAIGSDREEDFIYVRPSLSVGITPRLSASLFYEYRRSEGTGADALSFRGNRFGMQMAYAF